MPIILVACKIDERNRGIECISTAQGMKIAKEIRARTFFECSSRSGVGVQEVVDTAAEIGITHSFAALKAAGRCVMF